MTAPSQTDLLDVIAAARRYIHGPEDDREVLYAIWRKSYKRVFGIYPTSTATGGGD